MYVYSTLILQRTTLQYCTSGSTLQLLYGSTFVLSEVLSKVRKYHTSFRTCTFESTEVRKKLGPASVPDNEVVLFERRFTFSHLQLGIFPDLGTEISTNNERLAARMQKPAPVIV